MVHDLLNQMVISASRFLIAADTGFFDQSVHLGVSVTSPIGSPRRNALGMETEFEDVRIVVAGYPTQ